MSCLSYRVAQMEKKKDETAAQHKNKQTQNSSENKSAEDSDEEEFEEFFDWRNKK